jgi:glycosyltransferase involved in cell wall biosynthesis
MHLEPAPAATPQLTIVMPVYNEETAVAPVIAAWTAEMQRLGLDYRISVYDDGSADGTGAILDELVRYDPRLVVVHQANRGHGPTVLRGYREARGEWVFQVDSDGEMSADAFAALWQRREAFDLLIGSRADRRAPVMRRLVTGVSRLTVRTLFGAGIHDVNSPYRLFRGTALQALVARLPGEPFAPNVILAGLAVRAGLRIGEWPVPCGERKGGRGSLNLRRLVQGAARSFVETVAAGLRGPGGPA